MLSSDFANIISIHAPREGGDKGICVQNSELVKISIHAPREGGDCIYGCSA